MEVTSAAFYIDGNSSDHIIIDKGLYNYAIDTYIYCQSYKIVLYNIYSTKL